MLPMRGRGNQFGEIQLRLERDPSRLADFVVKQMRMFPGCPASDQVERAFISRIDVCKTDQTRIRSHSRIGRRCWGTGTLSPVKVFTVRDASDHLVDRDDL